MDHIYYGVCVVALFICLLLPLYKCKTTMSRMLEIKLLLYYYYILY